MTTSIIRDKLYDFIKTADEKKLKAIYMILEDDIIGKSAWWKDKEFMKELEHRYDAWETGKEKGYTLEEVRTMLEAAEKKHGKK